MESLSSLFELGALGDSPPRRVGRRDCYGEVAFTAVLGWSNIACIGIYLEEVYKQSFISNSEALV